MKKSNGFQLERLDLDPYDKNKIQKFNEERWQEQS